MEGFIQLHRQMLDWEWYNDINTKTLFIHLLLKANWKDKKWRGIDVYRGEYITSFGKLSEETGLSIQQVRTGIKKLKSTQEVTQKSQGSFSIIKVLKYNQYQTSNTEDNKPVTSEQQTSNKRATTTNKVIKKESNKEINIINSIDNEISKEISPQNNKTDFKELCKNIDLSFYINKYEMTELDFKDEANQFYMYWTEKSTNGKKERWEKQKTFDVVRRFDTWMRNNEKWNKQNLSYKPTGIGQLD